MRMLGHSLSDSEREIAIKRAGLNVLNLDAADVAIDLITDAASRALGTVDEEAAARGARGAVGNPDLQELASAIYGPARYVFTSKGRAAEDALASAIAKPGGVVLTHGLFHSTGRAFSRHGMQVKHAPIVGRGCADLQPAALEQAFSEGPVDIVCLEPCNNAWAGWPMTLAGLEDTARVCRQRGVMLVLDATRILTNCARLELPVQATAIQMLSLTDAFVVSCAKELLAPHGALAAVRRPDLEARIWEYCFERGTALEPSSARVALGLGMQEVLRRPSLYSERCRVLAALQTQLRDRKIRTVEPTGGHAVYVDVTELMAGRPSSYARALEAALYRASGVRAMIHPNAQLERSVMRLPLGVGALTEPNIEWIAEGVRAMFELAPGLSPLVAVEGECLHPLLGRYAESAA